MQQKTPIKLLIETIEAPFLPDTPTRVNPLRWICLRISKTIGPSSLWIPQVVDFPLGNKKTKSSANHVQNMVYEVWSSTIMKGISYGENTIIPLFMGGMPIFLYMGNTPYFDPGLYNVIHELINHWLVDHRGGTVPIPRQIITSLGFFAATPLTVMAIYQF